MPKERKWFKKSYLVEMSSNISRTTSFFEGSLIKKVPTVEYKMQNQNSN